MNRPLIGSPITSSARTARLIGAGVWWWGRPGPCRCPSPQQTSLPWSRHMERRYPGQNWTRRCLRLIVWSGSDREGVDMLKRMYVRFLLLALGPGCVWGGD